MALSARALKGREFSTLQKGGASIQRRSLSPLGALGAYAWIGLVLLVVLSPHIGVLLLSLAQVWSFSPLPDAYTLAHYNTVFQDASGLIQNTLVYCGIAAGLDVLLGVTIAYLMLRTTLPARQWLDWLASAALAVPGIVLAIGYLRLYKGVVIPGTDQLLTGTWVMIMLAYAVRRLPYALRSCVAALQQLHVSLEEAAESLGATPLRSIRRVVLPLMAGGILAGFVTSFITAAVELSATILLVSADSQAPMSYGIYLYMQSVAGRGPGAALGVLAIVVVALGTYLSHVVVERTGSRFVAKPLDEALPPLPGTTAPNTPPCILIMLIAARWLPWSVAAQQSSSRRHSKPRSLASRIVVCTHTSVVMPVRMRLRMPRVRRISSRSVAQNEPLPGLSITGSPAIGASSSMICQPGSPRTRMRPQGPGSPMPTPFAPICRERQRLLAGRSARSGRWPSRVWITCMPSARASASRAWIGPIGARVIDRS